MTQYLWLVPALPLAGAVINAIFSRKMPRKLVSAIAVGAVGLAFLMAIVEFLAMQGGGEHRIFDLPVYSWIPVGKFQVNIALLLDPLSALMILVVTGVGFLIHIYSTGYMADDESYGRFFTYLNLFVFSMLMLVLGDNYLVMYMGWELVGLCSYLLISFWFNRPSAAAAGKKAFITTRVGDFGFGLGVILIFVTFGTLNFSTVFDQAPKLFQAGAPVITAITLLLFAGAVGKSAQLPLYVWLPDAMEGPTPVSALIHAATMVTAGVYMVARSHVLFSLAPLSSEVVAVIGAVTALYAATIALVQMDLKRVLAYSTISQLGYMFLGVGVGAFGAGIFHLMTHAFFKALLFLAAGSVMHAMSGIIDMRQLGGLRSKMRWTYITFLAAALAISGFPLFSGFFSKDEILASAFESGHTVLWGIGLITAGLTAFYIFRAFFLTFHGDPRWVPAKSAGGTKRTAQAGRAQTKGSVVSPTVGHGTATSEHATLHPHESPASMTVPLMILAVLSVIAGVVGLPSVLGPNLLEGYFAPVFGELTTPTPAATEWLLIAASVVAGLVGIGVAYWFYIVSPEMPVNLAARFKSVYNVLWNKYYVDEIYSAVTVRFGQSLATFLWQDVDVGVIDGIANGLGQALGAASRGLRRIQTGYARAYALAMLGGTVLVIGWLILK
ncbi:MAG: NADH-quinone oxidoreductase subunit L [Chloroflexi bacterium]|nr:NADH-quinone oxidoreductase subunit L [Chloroflexota bacterium]